MAIFYLRKSVYLSGTTARFYLRTSTYLSGRMARFYLRKCMYLSGTMAICYLMTSKYLSGTRARFYLRKSMYLSGTRARFNLRKFKYLLGQGPSSTWGSPSTVRDNGQVLPEEVQVLVVDKGYVLPEEVQVLVGNDGHVLPHRHLPCLPADVLKIPTTENMYCTIVQCMCLCTEVGTPFCLLYYVMKCNTKQGFCTWRQCYRKHPTRRQIMWVIGIIYPY